MKLVAFNFLPLACSSISHISNIYISRLYPSVPIIGRRVEQETTIDGLTMPQGSTAVVFVHLLHRNPDIWTNPNDFDPERFLDQG